MTQPLKILAPVDGSDASVRAVAHAIDLSQRGLPVEIHLLNVQTPVRGAAATFVPHADLESYHREEGEKALAEALRTIEAAGLPRHEHIGLGDPGETIVAFVGKLGCDHVVMGTHGRGGVAEILMGSVAQHVVSHAPVPVTLVR